MSTPMLDQDNVLNEPPSAFDGAPAVPERGPKAPKAASGKIPLWIWGVIALAVLLVTFVIFRVVVGRRAVQSPEQITPIVQTETEQVAPQPALAPAVDAPGAQPELVPAQSVQSSLQIPGDEPVATPAAVAPPTDHVAAPGPTAEVAAQPVGTSPQADAAIAPAAPNALTADERKRLNERIEALSGDVQRLEKRLIEANEAKTPRKPVKPARRTSSASVDRKPAPTQPQSAQITGLTLKAVVDDSAWLQTETGETVMVQPGDVLHGIGTVKEVDPDKGTVRLLDGRTLR